RKRRPHHHEALRKRAPDEHAELVLATRWRSPGLQRRLAGSVPAGRLHPDPVAFFIAEPVAVAERAAVRPALGPAVDTSDGIGPGVALAVRATDAIAPALTELMLAMNDPETPFLDSVERRRPGTSLRGYVTRTLPHSSAIVIANRAPHEPRPEGGFTRGAGGVITALLTLAEVAGAAWVECARTEGEPA